MSIIEQIKAEIERQEKQCPLDTYEGRHKLFILGELKTFLSTLESEIPNDLEGAADNHIRKVVDAAGHPGWDWTTQDIADAFIAGAKWDREQMMKETERSPKPELTIQDIELLHTFLYAVKNNKHGVFTFTRLSNEQYQEVFNRFKISKEERNER